MDALLKGPELISAALESTDRVKLAFDKPVEPASVKKSDFKFSQIMKLVLRVFRQIRIIPKYYG